MKELLDALNELGIATAYAESALPPEAKAEYKKDRVAWAIRFTVHALTHLQQAEWALIREAEAKRMEKAQ